MAYWYSEYLMAMGRFDEAAAEKQLAIDLDPLAPYFYSVAGWPHIFSGRFDKAIELSKKAISMDPNAFAAHGALGRAYLFNRRYDKAIQEFQEAIRLAGQHPT